MATPPHFRLRCQKSQAGALQLHTASLQTDHQPAEPRLHTTRQHRIGQADNLIHAIFGEHRRRGDAGLPRVEIGAELRGVAQTRSHVIGTAEQVDALVDYLAKSYGTAPAPRVKASAAQPAK